MKDYNDNLFKGANAKQFEFSKELRQRHTKPEEIIWELLRNRKLNGLKFRRQHPILNYIADFYCHEIKLVIEIDGKIHNSQENKDYDNERNKELKEEGVTTLRFSNEEVLNELPNVLKKLKNFIIHL